MASAQVRPGEGRAIRHRRIDCRVQPITGAHERGEHPELPDRAAALAFEPRARQARLRHRADDQIVANRENGVRDFFQKGGAGFQVGRRKASKRSLGKGAGPFDMIRSRRAEVRPDRLPVRRIKGLEALVAGDVSPADENGTCDHASSFARVS
jgi:hypothetical protein